MSTRRSFLKALAGLIIAPSVALKIAKAAPTKVEQIPDLLDRDALDQAKIDLYRIFSPPYLPVGSIPYSRGNIVCMEAGLPVLKGQALHTMPDLKVYPTPTALDYAYHATAIESADKGELIKVQIG